MPTYKLAITVDEGDNQKFVELITAILTFGRIETSGRVNYPELQGISFEPDPDYVDPVIPTEAEDVRAELRPILQEYATNHGMALAKELLTACGSTGIATASHESLAQLRHYFKKYKEAKHGGSKTKEVQDSGCS